jgi:hypothetical protein
MEPTGFAGYRSRRTAARSSPWQADQPAHDRAPGRQPPQTGSPCTADVSAPIRRKRETLRHQRVALFRKPTGHRASGSGPCVTRLCRWVVHKESRDIVLTCVSNPSQFSIGATTRMSASRHPDTRSLARTGARRESDTAKAVEPPPGGLRAPLSGPTTHGGARTVACCRTCAA